MKSLFLLLLVTYTLVFTGGCSSDDRVSALKKCTVLGGESILYARANYVKLFHYFNPEKFSDSYQQTKEFDHVTTRNIINTYDIAIRKLKPHDEDTKSLIASCQKLADFSKALVDQSYPRAISHQSQYDILSDAFFIEINQIVKFDHNIGEFDKNTKSFKQYVEEYRNAVQNYLAKYKNELPEEIISSL